jgi:hypothetical protein
MQSLTIKIFVKEDHVGEINRSYNDHYFLKKNYLSIIFAHYK